MFNQVLVTEMVSVAERELMVENARRGRNQWKAQAGHVVGQQDRARNKMSALLQRMGRPFGKGSAPAGGEFPRLDTVAIYTRANSC
jgi:hypothetical protein